MVCRVLRSIDETTCVANSSSTPVQASMPFVGICCVARVLWIFGVTIFSG